MKLSSANRLLAISILMPTALLAQHTSYLDENYKPATAASYKYKRVLKWTGEEMNANLGVGYYGNFTTHLTGTGIQTCTLTDYYNNGAPALMVNVISFTKDCKDPLFNGQAVFYYPDGHIKRKVYYNAGKAQGNDITYNPDGSIKNTEYYQNGAKLDTKSFAVSPNNPMLGTWKYVEYNDWQVPGQPRSIKKTLINVFSENGILEIGTVTPNGARDATVKVNWKYIPKSATAGVLEGYLGTELVERDDITWINRNKFESVCTLLSQNANGVGTHLTFERE